MKPRILVSAMTAAIVFATVAAVSAQPCEHHKGMGAGKEPQYRMFADLNLSDQQKTDLKKLHTEMTELRQKHLEAVKEVRKKMKDELLKESPSQNVLYGYAGELGELHKQMSKDHVDHLLKVRKILTPEQFSKLVEKQEGMDFGKGFMGRCGGGGCRGMKGKCPHQKGNCPHMENQPTEE